MYGVKAIFNKECWPLNKEVQVSEVKKDGSISYWSGTIYGVSNDVIIVRNDDSIIWVSLDDYLDEIYKLVVIE